MKKLLALIFLLISSQLFAQRANQINGKVISSSSSPVEFATISLINSVDSSITKFALTDLDGNFQIENSPIGNYSLKASFVGYQDTFSKSFEITNESNSITLETIIMPKLSQILGEVVVKAQKALIEQKLDRMIINVDASVTNVGSTALEVLQKSPGISVNQDGKISLKGKSEVLVMIDNKPTYLSSADLASLLSNMNANQLNQIEIMTNPSAKYDAAGNAGVINIKTKKSESVGLNGSLTLSYGQGQYAKTNNNVMLNYRSQKMNGFLNYGYSLNKSFLNFDIQRNFMESYALDYSLNQLSNRMVEHQNNNLKLGMDYYINPNTTIGIVSSGFLAPNTHNSFTNSEIVNYDGQLLSRAETITTASNTMDNVALNLNFRSLLDEKNKKEISSSIDFMHFNFGGNQNILGNNFDENNTLLSSIEKLNSVPLSINILSGRIDYSQELGKGLNFETGLKTSAVKTDNVSDFYNKLDGITIADSLFTNSFNYKENNNAAYVNFNKTMGLLSVQLGLRLENTNYEGVQSSLRQTEDSLISRNYTKLFPTLFTSYQLNTDNIIGLNIGRRIDRPAYQHLNPFVAFIDKYTISRGNPFLQPQFSNTVELSHTYKNFLTTTINYGVVNEMMNETLIQRDSMIIRSFGNIGQQFNFGISESISLLAGNWYSGTIFANLYNNTYRGSINNLPFNASQWTVALNVNNQFKLKNGWAAEVSGTYVSKNREEGQALALSSGQLLFGVSKQLFDNKASIKFNVSDVFYTMNPIEIQNFQNIQSTMQMSRDTRVATLAFVYRFGGNAKAKIPNSAPTDEEKRVQSF